MISTTINVTKVSNIVKNASIHMVITDYNMPELDGLTLAKQLRTLGYTYPIILLTAYKDELLVKNALAAGIDYCLEKHLDAYQTYLDILHYMQDQIFIERV